MCHNIFWWVKPFLHVDVIKFSSNLHSLKKLQVCIKKKKLQVAYSCKINHTGPKGKAFESKLDHFGKICY